MEKSKLIKFKVTLLVALLMALVPFFHATAQTSSLQYSVWIAYWKKVGGVTQTSAHLNQIQTVTPFGYSVRADGTLADTAKIDEYPWPDLLKAARESKKLVIPSIMWSNTDVIHRVLSTTKTRNSHIKEIVKLVNDKKYDGIEIDYEAKKVATRTYFSQFLKDLSLELDKTKKSLVCTIESRTPLTSRFTVVPKDVAYVNDYAVIGKYCDEVRIMAYDQSNIDIKLNKSKGTNAFYQPVSDTDWVEKVIVETLKTIPKAKVVLGVATYGREFAVSTSTTGYKYKMIRSLNYKGATELAASLGVVPQRNNAGELGFSYVSTSTLETRFVTFSDSVSASAKIDLAKKYKLKGVALFKIDEDIDMNTWNILK